MRKELKEEFSGFFEQEKQDMIAIKTESISMLQTDFSNILLPINSKSKTHVIEIEKVMETGKYCSFIIEEYTFTLFKIEDVWYGIAWIYSFYEDKTELSRHVKKKIKDTKMFENLNFDKIKCYRESNFFPFKFSSFKSKLLNEIDLKEERFVYLLLRDYKKIKKSNLSLTESVYVMYDRIGNWYISNKFNERSEIINLIEIEEDGSISKESLELIELNYSC